MLVLDYDNAHDFVISEAKNGSDIRWDGYSMVIFKPTPHGFKNRRGAFRNGAWGMESRIPLATDGKWRIPAKYVTTR